MRTLRILVCGCASLVAAACGWASDGEIGIFFDPAASQCQASIPCGETGTLYFYALLEGSSIGGITGAEYGLRINGDNDAEPDWVFQETFAPGTVVLGTGAFLPIDATLPWLPDRRYRGRGVNVAWPSCQTGDGAKVLLETVQVTNAGCTDQDLVLLVTSHDTPSNQVFQCPLFVLCDGPVYTKVCLGRNLTVCRNPEPPYALNATCSTSGSATISATVRPPLPCRPTAVRTSTWSGVKRLYRD